MTIELSAKSLKRAARDLEALADDASVALSYAADHLSLKPVDMGLAFQHVVTAINDVDTRVANNVAEIRIQLEAAATKLTRSVDDFVRVDRRSREESERTKHRVDDTPRGLR